MNFFRGRTAAAQCAEQTRLTIDLTEHGVVHADLPEAANRRADEQRHGIPIDLWEF